MIVVPGIVCIVLPTSASLSRRPPRSDRFFHTLPNTRTHYSVCNCLLTMLLIDKSTQKCEQNNASASRSPGRPISSLLVKWFLFFPYFELVHQWFGSLRCRLKSKWINWLKDFMNRVFCHIYEMCFKGQF